MSTEALSDDPPEAGLAWVTLLLSSGLLGALFVWSLQNPSVLLPSLSTVEAPGQQTKNTDEASAATSLSGSESLSSVDTGVAAPAASVETAQISETSQASMVDTATESFNAPNQTGVEEPAETPFERLMRQELATLPGLAGRVRYNPQESVPLEGSDKLLNRMFELLFLYIDSNVVVKISSGDFEDDDKNLELSESRAQNLVAYLVDRGLDAQRFEIVPLGREALPLGGHRVNVYAKDI